MKAPALRLALIASVASTVALLSSPVDARPMHDGLDYHRYLQEKEAVAQELDAWMQKYQDAGEKNGWIPPTESRSAEEVREDRLQRYFLSKQLVEELERANPDAEFSTDSPFSLLTTDEFAAYVKNAYASGMGVEGNPNPSPNAQRRVLRAADSSSLASAVETEERAETSEAAQRTPVAKIPSSFSFEDLMKWPSQYLKKPEQPQPQPTLIPAPVPTNTTPPQPKPEPKPKPTASPSATTAPVGPVSSDVGPVAPDLGPDHGRRPSKEVALDGSGRDWSTHQCMPPVQNQGQCASCWAFAAVSASESALCIRQMSRSNNANTSSSSPLIKLSEQSVASCNTRNYGCRGGWPVWTFEHIQQEGICRAADDPYTSGDGRLAACNRGCDRVRVPIQKIQTLQGEQQLFLVLKEYPVLVGVAAGNSAWKQYKGGVLSTCDTERQDHVVVAVGYDATTIKVRNSWGPRWGEGGYMRLRRVPSSMTGTCGVTREITHIVM
ncbi:hypothetical protein PINS_up009706 [Pythium insidiosum]|nr:hypothetical protein PINS_up009704 [Pythium insidiosum]GLE00909.1 hypothetical protein PINS_up009706 [Pythium insidiosum]